MNNPPLADSTELISIHDCNLPLITICPINQFNITKLEKYGFFEAKDFLAGMIRGQPTVSWGADLNMTFDQYLDHFLTYSPDTDKVVTVDSIFKSVYYSNKYTAALKRKFYVSNLGYCWDLENYSAAEMLLIRSSIKDEKRFNVFITDNRLRSFDSIAMDTHDGEIIQITSAYRYIYDVSLSIVSYKIPTNANACADYEDGRFRDCVDKNLQTLVKPLLHCNPPWLSPTDQCQDVVNLTNDEQKELKPTLYSIIMRENFDARDNCKTSCNVTYSQVSSQMKMGDWQYELKLIFDAEATYSNKLLTYDISNFLIDVGSSMGLWFGMSVFGLTDLGIQIFYGIKNLKKKTNSVLS